VYFPALSNLNVNVFPVSSLELLSPNSSTIIRCGLFVASFLNVTLPPTATFTSPGCAVLSLKVMTSSGPAGVSDGVIGVVSCGVVGVFATGVCGVDGVCGVTGVCGFAGICFAQPTNNRIARIAMICIAFIVKPPCIFIDISLI